MLDTFLCEVVAMDPTQHQELPKYEAPYGTYHNHTVHLLHCPPDVEDLPDYGQLWDHHNCPTIVNLRGIIPNLADAFLLDLICIRYKVSADGVRTDVQKLSRERLTYPIQLKFVKALIDTLEVPPDSPDPVFFVHGKPAEKFVRRALRIFNDR